MYTLAYNRTMTILQMLDAIMAAKGWNQTELGEALGVKQSTVSRWYDGQDPRGKTRDRIQALYRSALQLDDASSIEVPRLPWVPAGEWWQPEQINDHDELPTITVTDLPQGDWVAIEVKGSSMDRISPPGSIIFVDRSDTKLIQNGCYVIADEEGRTTYKRYRPNPDRFEPVTFTEGHETIFPEGQITVIGRVKRSIIDM